MDSTPTFRVVLLVTTLALAFACRHDPRSDRGSEPAAQAARPQRILPANAGALDFVLALCEPERIVALSPVSIDYSVGAHELGVADALRAKANLGVWNGETALSTAPDLVIMSHWQDRAISDLMERSNIRVVVLPDVVTFDDVVRVLTELGEAVGEPERAAVKIADLRARVDALRARAPLTDLRVMTYTNLGVGGSTAGAGTTYDTVIRLAGLRNAAAEAGLESFQNVDFERLVAIDPDAFVVGLGADDDDELGASERFLRETKGWDALRAVREERYLRLPSRLFATNSHWLVRAAEELRDAYEAARDAR